MLCANNKFPLRTDDICSLNANDMRMESPKFQTYLAIMLSKLPTQLALLSFSLGAFGTVMASVLSQDAAHAQALPRLEQGMTLSAATQRLKAAGWQMKYAYPSCLGHRSTIVKTLCKDYPNVQECSANGYCDYTWVNVRGEKLRLVGYGYPTQGLINWGLE